jgi:hypothetical protein
MQTQQREQTARVRHPQYLEWDTSSPAITISLENVNHVQKEADSRKEEAIRSAIPKRSKRNVKANEKCESQVLANASAGDNCYCVWTRDERQVASQYTATYRSITVELRAVPALGLLARTTSLRNKRKSLP